MRPIKRKANNNISNRAIAKTLYALRKERYLSQESVAEKIGVNRATYTYWERSHCCPKLEIIELLSNAFEISEAEFFEKYLKAKGEIKNAERNNHVGETDSESDSSN